MTYDHAQQMLKRHPEVTFAYQPHMDFYHLICADEISCIYPEDLGKMAEADFMYAVAHILRMAKINSATYVTVKH